MRLVMIIAACVAFAGCTDEIEQKDRQIRSLNIRIQELVKENSTMAQTLPSEQPAVVKELEEAKKLISDLRVELQTTKQALAMSDNRIPGEIVPFAVMVKTLSSRVAALEAAAPTYSRKGHSHSYHQKDSFIPSRTGSD